jgi:putative DNA primase/helicase
MSKKVFEWPDGQHAGLPVPSFVNICAGINAAIDVRFNDLTSTPIAKAKFLGSEWQTINDAVCASIRDYFIEAYRFDPGRGPLAEALKHIAWRNRFNPVAEEYRALRHDGDERIDKFFVDYAGAANNALNRAAGRLFWLSHVARVLTPGCDCQIVLVWYAPQGAGKSTALRIIAGDPSRFTDQDVVHLPVERQQEALRGRVIVEASELGGFDRHAVERVKSFISRSHDRARPAWGSCAVDQPRSFVIVATTNEMQILRDSTGNRRFLPLELKAFDLEALKRDRDQLIAEAVDQFDSHTPLTLPEELWEDAIERQKRYTLDDPIEELLAPLKGDVRKGEERLPFCAIWTLLSIGPTGRTPSMKRRIVEAMRRSGWSYTGKPFRIGKETHRGFRRPAAD